MSRESLVSLMVLLAIAAAPVLAQDRLSEFPTKTGIGGFPQSQPAPFPQGPITFYGDRPTFDAAHPGLPCEDFQEFTDAITGCDAPANNGTSCPSGYNPGDILLGLEIDCAMNSGPAGTGLVIVPTGFDANPSITFGSNFFTDNTILRLAPAVAAVGLDIHCIFQGPPSVTVDVYDGAGALVASTVSGCSNAFLGIDSSAPDGIGRVEINEPTGGASEQVDNICFGEMPIPVELTGFEVE
jgi:hypothetical protein